MWNYVNFISLFCDLIIWSLLLILFPDCWILKKMSHVRRLRLRRLRKQSSVCLGVFSCEYNPSFVIMQLLSPTWRPIVMVPPHSHLLTSLNPPLLTKCHACLRRSYSQAWWRTHCTLSVILNLFPLSHVSLLNLFKIFRQVSCLSDCIQVLSKPLYWFPFFSPKH